MIVIGALAYRSATFIYMELREGFAVRKSMAFSSNVARRFLIFYVISGIPLAFLNGYLLRLSWMDCLVVGGGTWLGMLASIALTRRFNPVFQFFLFATASLLWLGFDAVRLFNTD